MARKIDPSEKIASNPTPQASTQQDDAAHALEILHPERQVRVGDQTLTVREYGFLEGLALQRQAAPILEELLAATADTDEALERILTVLTDQPDTLLGLVAESCIAPLAPDASSIAKATRAYDIAELVATLKDPIKTTDADGQALLMTWWIVNGGFFVRRVVRRLAARGAKTTPASTGATSSPPSPDSAEATTPAPSATTTPSVN